MAFQEIIPCAVIVLINIAIGLGIYGKNRCQALDMHSSTGNHAPGNSRGPISKYSIINIITVSLSLMSTSISPYITALILPQPNLNFLVMILGYLIASCISAFTICPLLYSQNLSTINQYFKRRFGNRSVVLFGAVWILLNEVFLASILLYAPCKRLSDLVNQNFWLILISATVIAAIYISLGGIKAAVLCESIHGITIIFCFIIMATTMADDEKQATWKEWLSLKMFTPKSLSGTIWYKGHSLWWSVLPGCLSSLRLYGAHQASLQRLNQLGSSKQTICCVLLQVIFGSILTCLLKGFGYLTMDLRLLKVNEHVWLRALISLAFYSSLLSSISPVMTTTSSIVRSDVVKRSMVWLNKRITSVSCRKVVEKVTVIVVGVWIILSTIVCKETPDHFQIKYTEALSVIGSSLDGPHATLVVVSMFLPCIKMKGAVIAMVITCLVEMVIKFIGAYQLLAWSKSLVNDVSQSDIPPELFNSTSVPQPKSYGRISSKLFLLNDGFLDLCMLVLSVTIGIFASLISESQESPSVVQNLTISVQSLQKAYSSRLITSPASSQRHTQIRLRVLAVDHPVKESSGSSAPEHAAE